MKKFSTLVILFCSWMSLSVFAQQVPNSDFEDWSGEQFDGEIQPATWHYSNVTQFGFKFNFSHRETGHSGKYCAMVQDQDVGAAGITETSPGYFSLGQPWVYIESLTKVSYATAGTYGGISWKYRPDTMSVWIKRTGSNVTKEDYHLLYYSWKGQAVGNKYKAKNGSCTSTEKINEESDVRLSTDGNECGTSTKAVQVSEGWQYEKKAYNEWTQIKVPIHYMSNDVPDMMNIIFSASNYPNFRANSGLYAGNSLYVDDLQMIYSSKIQILQVDGLEWLGFNPNTEEEQIYSLGESATRVPDIVAIRGKGTLTNSKGQKTSFPGRVLSGSEIEIKKGGVDEVTTIRVKAEDGSSETTYRIRFSKAASTNAYLAGLWFKQSDEDSTAISSFNAYTTSCVVELPYGTTEVPTLSATRQEDAQTVKIVQAKSLSDKATITVTAADKKTTRTYTVSFKVALLSDNTLQDILVDGVSVAGFVPSQTIYRVSLPLGTTKVPTVKAVSAYPKGEQTITYQAPETVDGGVYQIAVTTPGNTNAKIYKLTFKLEASTYSKLKDIQLDGMSINSFDPNAGEFNPETYTYYVSLPMGTQELPSITWSEGDPYQTVSLTTAGVNGTSVLTVKAASGAQSVYKIVFSALQSSESNLNMIYVDGQPLEGFAANKYAYTYQLPVGTMSLPEITYDRADEFETVNILSGGMNGVTRITVTAGDGSASVYQITFSVELADNANLNWIKVDGQVLDGWSPTTYEYAIQLDKSVTKLPTIEYEQHDAGQTVNVRTFTGLTGDYKITVIAESGAKNVYILHFTQEMSSEVRLKNILLDGVSMEDFDPEVTEYVDTLPLGKTTVPEVSYQKWENGQKVIMAIEGTTYTITVTAESGQSREYRITFITQKSENAFLDMIYVDGNPLPDYKTDSFTYVVQLPTNQCPTISVDKANPLQQVLITYPVVSGDVHIRVTPESGASNEYVLTLLPPQSELVKLQMIYLDGVELENFDPTKTSYQHTYSHARPKVTCLAPEGLEVAVVEHRDETVVYTSQADLQTQYTIQFSRQKKSDKSLTGIYLDGVMIDGFAPSTMEYLVTVEAGQTKPQVTYTCEEGLLNAVFAGQESDSVYSILVVAEDDSRQQYRITFRQQRYSETRLKNIFQNGVALAGFARDTYLYACEINEGEALPVLSVEKELGQTILINSENANRQSILVVAENGDSARYEIQYTRIEHYNALLSNILIYVDGNWINLPNFDTHTAAYTYHQNWTDFASRPTAVPCVCPVSDAAGQDITIAYGKFGEQTTITVTSADGAQQQVYTILFTIQPSSNTLLGKLEIDYAPQDVTNTEIAIELPYDAELPIIEYAPAEPGQQIEYVDGGRYGKNKLVVTAENGDTRTYTISYTVLEPVGENTIQAIAYSYTTSNGDTKQGVINSPKEGNNAVNLPYGARNFTITGVTKSYEEQAVMLLNAGVRRESKVIVSANQKGVEDRTYVVTPVLPEYDTKGKLKTLKFNGTLVPNFRPDVYNYIIGVETEPVKQNFTYQAYSGAQVTVSALDAKKKQVTFKVKDGETYSVCWYYTNCEGFLDFTGEWVKASQGNGYKPTADWKVPADFASEHSFTIPAVVSLIYTTGKEVTPAGSNGVMLSTLRGAPMNTSVPGMMTLGSMSLTLGNTGSSSSSVEKNATLGVSYKNTPESFAFRAKPISTSNISKWNVWVSISDGTQMKGGDVHSYDFSQINNWMNVDIPLDCYGLSGTVKKFNCMLSSCDQENANEFNGSTIYESSVMYENLHFVYNSHLTGATVDGEPAMLSGNVFSKTVAADYVGLPALKFTGEVHDQMQTIEWLNNGEWIDGKLQAKVTNYGENAKDTTVYFVRLEREAVSDLTVTVSSHGENVNPGIIMLPNGTKRLSDLTITPASIHQRVQVSKKDWTYTVLVINEQNDSATYIYTFQETKTANTQLAALSVFDPSDLSKTLTLDKTFDPAQTSYTVSSSVMPQVIKAGKVSEGQTVNIKNGVITVTAENGTAQQTYTILTQSSQEDANGTLNSLLVNGELYNGFMPTTRHYQTASAPLSHISFVREQTTDSVTERITPDSILFTVEGNAVPYTLVYPVHASNNANLDSILVNGRQIDFFNPNTTEYTLLTDTAVSIRLVGVDARQSTEVSYDIAQRRYSIRVKAEDQTTEKTYILQMAAPKSAVATLRAILVNGDTLPDFYADKLAYTIVLPADSPKQAEPMMPSIQYVLTDPNAKAEMDPSGVGSNTTIMVTSEDGKVIKNYQLSIEAEKSHYAQLGNIMIDSKPIIDFQPNRYFYSVQTSTMTPALDYSSEDFFQTVDTTHSGNTIILNVAAEDGNTERYFVDLYQVGLSNNKTLNQILLNGKTFTEFDATLPAFDPMQNLYTISLAEGETQLPDVSATRSDVHQELNIQREGLKVLLNVKAENGDENTYTLLFTIPKSSNDNLKMLVLDGDSLDGFDPDVLVYQVALPIGVRTLPNVYAQKGDATQNVVIFTDTLAMKTDVVVTAEDGTSQTYTLLYNYTYSQADTLISIYQDGRLLDNFNPQVFYYSMPLEVGTTRFPDLTWAEADQWQTIRMDTVAMEADHMSRQIVVVAENGHKNSYTIVYEILKSEVDTLQMIFVDNKQLSSFAAQQTEYYYTLEASAEALPEVFYAVGDAFQTVTVSQMTDASVSEDMPDSIKALNQKIEIKVVSEKGNSRTYTIHFSMKKSTNTQLAMIWKNAQPLPEFNKEVLAYTIQVPYDPSERHMMPAITVSKMEDAQNVDVTAYGDSMIVIHVLAEDGVQMQDYMIEIQYGKSPMATLGDILINHQSIPDFRADSLEYEARFFANEPLPEIEWLAGHEGQTLSLNEPQEGLTEDGYRTVLFTCDVTSPDEDHFMSYSLLLLFNKVSADTTAVSSALTSLKVFDQPVDMAHGFDKDFRSDTLNYAFQSYPVGSLNDAFFGPEAISYTTEDPLAIVDTLIVNHELPTDTFVVQKDGTVIFRLLERSIMLTVSDRNGKNPTQYVIKQKVEMSHDSALIQVNLGDDPFLDFDPSVHSYTRTIKAGTSAPEPFCIARDDRARTNVAYEEVHTETGLQRVYTVTCLSEYAYAYDPGNSELRNVYTFTYTESELNESQTPMEADVLLKRLPYSTQVVLASLRSNVQVSFYDMNGEILLYRTLLAIDPSNAVITTDGYNQTYLTDVLDVSKCTILSLEPNKLYFYCFLENGKRKIMSGKIMITK